jgi:flavorubredoxin
MDRFLAEAPGSVLVASEIGAAVNLSHWGYKGAVQGMRDGDRLELGAHRLRFLETPHVHHWDSMMVLDEATSSLFPADLLIQPGEQPPVIKEDLSAEMLALYRGSGIFAHEEPVRRVVRRLQELAPAWVHPMHGGSFTDALAPRFYQALLNESFAFNGTARGRQLPS